MGKKNKTSPQESAATTSSDTAEGSEPGSPKPQKKRSWHKDSTEDLDEDYGEPTKFDPDFSGPVKKRSCTGKLL